MRDRLLHKILNELTGVPTYRKAAAIIDAKQAISILIERECNRAKVEELINTLGMESWMHEQEQWVGAKHIRNRIDEITNTEEL
jgi:hypothetical protein